MYNDHMDILCKLNKQKIKLEFFCETLGSISRNVSIGFECNKTVQFDEKLVIQKIDCGLTYHL